MITAPTWSIRLMSGQGRQCPALQAGQYAQELRYGRPRSGPRRCVTRRPTRRTVRDGLARAATVRDIVG